MQNEAMSLADAYECLIAYFEAQKQENRIFSLDDAQAYLAKSDTEDSQAEANIESTGDVLRDFAAAIPFLDEEKIGIATALDRVVVNLRQLKSLNIEQGIFLVHKHVKMEGGSAVRKLRIPPGSTMLGAKPPMPGIGRELLADPDGLKIALTELELAIEGNIVDASQDSYARLSGIVDAFKDVLVSVKENDFVDKLSFFTAEQSIEFKIPTNSIH